jgi:hypothetical protein
MEKGTFSHTPEVLAALDNSAIGGLNIFGRTDYRKGNGISKDTCVLAGIIVSIDRRGIDANILRSDDSTNLYLQMRLSQNANAVNARAA